MTSFASHPHRLGGYLESAPPTHVASILESVWIHRNAPDIPLASDAAHRVLPDGSFCLSFAGQRSEHGRVSNVELLAMGPVTVPHWYPLRSDHEMVSVKLKLEWVGPVLDLSPGDHADAMHDVPTIAPQWGRPLRDDLVQTRSASEALGVLVEFVHQRARSRLLTGSPSVGQRAVDLIRRSGGGVRLGDLSPRLGVTTRHLRRMVREAAGVGPKWYGRILRLLDVVRQADSTPNPSWSRLAADVGYCDQSHLIRECLALTGLSPEPLWRERRVQSEISNTC